MGSTDVAQAGAVDGPYYAVASGALRDARRRRLMTQRRLAEESGVHTATISGAERGVRRQIRAETLAALAGALGVEPRALLGDSQGSREEDGDER